jgi:hypothetical protein
MHFTWAEGCGHEIRAGSLYAAPLNRIPVNVGLENGEIGSAVGSGLGGVKAAVGELAERRHFARSVPSAARRFLHELECERDRSAVKEALAQVADGVSASELETLGMDMTNVVRLPAEESVAVPRCLVAVDLEGTEARLMPFRDTSGCAAHVDPAACIDAALREFIERQTLVACWIDSRGTARLQNFSELLTAAGDEIASCYRELRSVGEITILLLDGGLPGYTVFAYFCRTRSGGEIFFSSGAACAWELGSAVRKALAELWHCYVGMRIRTNGLDHERASFGRLGEAAIVYNVANAYARLRGFRRRDDHVVSAKDVDGSKTGSDDAIKRLARISESIFLYCGTEMCCGTLYVTAKVFSPAFFLHIDTARPLNVRNAYARYLALKLDSFDKSPLCFL